jgi:hypothetical protein
LAHQRPTCGTGEAKVPRGDLEEFAIAGPEFARWPARDPDGTEPINVKPCSPPSIEWRELTDSTVQLLESLTFACAGERSLDFEDTATSVSRMGSKNMTGFDVANLTLQVRPCIVKGSKEWST